MLPLQFYKFYLVAALMISPAISTQPNNSTLSEETQNATYITTAPSQNGVIKTDLTATCTKYVTQTTVKPVQLKAEPMCTESGSILDQLIRFIVYHFYKHECGNLNSTENFTEVLYCSMLNTHTMCLQPFQEQLKDTNTESVPQMSTVRDIIGELCAMDHLLAKDCMFRHMKYVLRCIKTEADSILDMENKRWMYGAIDSCRHLGVKVMCMWEGLQPCGKQTAGLMAHLTGVHLRSETCVLSGTQMAQPYPWFCFNIMFLVPLFIMSMKKLMHIL